MPLLEGFAENTRSLGLADMAMGIINNKPHRANGDLAGHVLDIMHGFLDASKKSKHVNLKSVCPAPEPLANVQSLTQQN